MRVAVTGATGFVGAHTVHALVQDGHEVRVLVRDRARLCRSMAALGLDPPDHVTGEMTDDGAVTELLTGADAVVHAAAVVSLDRRRAQDMMTANPDGLRAVVGAAAALGLDPIVYVSSTSALFRAGSGPLHEGHDVTVSADPYARSKAASESIARQFQTDGAPVVITYPSGILGPAVADAVGETTKGIASFVATGCLPTRHASLSLIDVRDLAAIHARLIRPHLGPRRIMCGGHHVTMENLADLLRPRTGRRFPMLPIPGVALRALGRFMDVLSAVVPVAGPITAESMGLVTQWAGTDDRALRALQVKLRSIGDTIDAALEACWTAGLVSRRQLGTFKPSAVRAS